MKLSMKGATIFAACRKTPAFTSKPCHFATRTLHYFRNASSLKRPRTFVGVFLGQNQITRGFTSLNVEATKTPATARDDGISPFQITTPIYYVNDKPHIGHAYTSTSCDVIARFMRLSGREVFFLSGTDEHGQKVEQSAAKKGMEPQDFVNEVSKSFKDLLELMNISNDMFIRTTDDKHKKAVQHLWQKLVDNGAIYLGSYEGWYSVRDECYYNESELVDGNAPTGSDVVWQAKEPTYFFKLSAFEDKLLEYYNTNPEFIAPKFRKNEMIGFVSGGLRDLSISRTTFNWGVPVPGDDDHVMYVWIDALANYISAIGYPDDTENFQKFWPANLHIVGKDILRFHAVYWPALLMAADLPIPQRLFAHGWWTKDGEKISKSLGNVIDPLELVEKVRIAGDLLFEIMQCPGPHHPYSSLPTTHSTVSIKRDFFSCQKSTLEATEISHMNK
jgi:methionyl-tRNA synthetase